VLSARPGSVGPGSWPVGVDLPVGRRVAQGTRLLEAVPVHGAVVVVRGARWSVRWSTHPGRLLPPPPWVLDVFGAPEAA
jgi:hypothetical protein